MHSFACLYRPFPEDTATGHIIETYGGTLIDGLDTNKIYRLYLDDLATGFKLDDDLVTSTVSKFGFSDSTFFFEKSNRDATSYMFPGNVDSQIAKKFYELHAFSNVEADSVETAKLTTRVYPSQAKITGQKLWACQVTYSFKI